MKSSFEILSALYQVIRPVVSNVITGDVYITHEPNDKLENVVVNLLNNPGTYVQSIIGNVNISCEGLNEHQANLARMKQILDMVMPLVDNVSHNVSGEDYHFEIEDDKGTFADQDIPGKFFYNIRVNCITV